MGKRMWQYVAMVMMVLIISMTPVFAYQISQVFVQGEDGIPGYVRSSDAVEVAASVTNPGSITPDQMTTLLKIGPFDFLSCELALSGEMVCGFSQQIDAGTRTIFPYEVRLYDQGGRLVDREPGTYYVDNTAPTIHLNTVRQDDDELVVDAQIIDHAFVNNPAGVCAGIAAVGVAAQGGGLLGEVSGPATGCVMDQEIRVPAGSLSTGTQVICVEAVDAFGLSDVACGTVEIDNSAPVIGTVRLRSLANPSLQFIGESEEAFIVFGVGENAVLEGVKVTVDGEEKSASCAGVGNGAFNCTTEMFTVMPGSYQAQVSVVDASGNDATQTQTFTLTRDETRPLLSFLGTDVVGTDGTIYVSDHTPIIARYAESGSGFHKQNAFLLLPSGDTIQADSCVKASQWECRWTGFTLGGVDGAYLFSPVTTHDDAGNVLQAGNGTVREMIADTTAPLITALEVYSLSGGARLPFGYSHAPLFIELDYDDASPLMGVADFTALGGTPAVGSCADGTCVFQSSGIGAGPMLQPVVINLTDAVGNTLMESVDVEVLTEANGTANYWQHTVKISPPSIDRGMAEMINNFVFAEVSLSSPAQAELVDVTLDGCRSLDSSADVVDDDRAAEVFATGGGDISFFQDYELLQIGDPTAATQFIKLTLKAASFKEVDTVDVVCDMRIISRQGSTFIPEEIENVPVSIPFFSTAAGDLGEAYEKELEDAIDDATEGILNKIASFEKFVNIARKICEVVKGIWDMWNGITEILGILGGVAFGLKSNPVTAGEGEAQSVVNYDWCEANEGGMREAEGLWKYAGMFCNFINCRFSLTGWLFNAIGGDEGKKAFSDLKNGLEGIGGGQLVNYLQDGQPGQSSNPGAEDSLFWSVLNLCIPGIIKNLNEYRQIKCRYALCLQEDVPRGVPKQACDTAKSYMTCKYVYGEIFASIPFVAFIDNIFKQIKAAFSTPTGALGLVIGGICSLFCIDFLAKEGGLYTTCGVFKIVKSLGEMITNVMRIFDKDTWQIKGQDVCEELDD